MKITVILKTPRLASELCMGEPYVKGMHLQREPPVNSSEKENIIRVHKMAWISKTTTKRKRRDESRDGVSNGHWPASSFSWSEHQQPAAFVSVIFLDKSGGYSRDASSAP
jgi:hypothetical protein